MSNSKTVKFKKDSIIFIDGQEPKYMFYIIIKGKVEAYSYFADNYTFQYKEGDIIGFYNAKHPHSTLNYKTPDGSDLLHEKRRERAG